MRKISLAILASTLLIVPALAQMKSEVKFAPGNYGTMISGTVVGNEYVDYMLEMKKGQKLFYDLNVTDSNGNGTVYMNLLPPGSDGVAIYIGANDVDTSETITLPESGVYTLRVYQMGNDKDTGKTSGFNMDVSVQ